MAKPKLLATLAEHDVHLNRAAEDLFQNPDFRTTKQTETIRIVVLSVSALGFQEGATYGQLTARALALGFQECPLELGPYLRLQFLEQREAPAKPSSAKRGAPSGALTIASSPLDDSDTTPKGFYLLHADSTCWLRGYWSDSDHVWSPEDVFVFQQMS